MLKLLRKIFPTRPPHTDTLAQVATSAEPSTPATVDLRLVMLTRFLKPRSLTRATQGWPEDLADPIVHDLLAQGDISPLIGLTEQFNASCTLQQLKDMLRGLGLPMSGAKAVLIRRLIDAGAQAPPDELRYGCSDTGRSQAEGWLAHRSAAIEQAASEALSFLKSHQIPQAIARSHEALAAWPLFEQVAVRFSPLAINGPDGLTERRVRLALSAIPGILRDVTADDLTKLQLAVAIWEAGLPNPGIDMAMAGYVGGSRFHPELAHRLLLFFVTNACNLQRSRAAGIVEAFVSFSQPCPACAKLDGRTYRLDAMPELPNPACQAHGCIFTVRSLVGQNVEAVE